MTTHQEEAEQSSSLTDATVGGPSPSVVWEKDQEQEPVFFEQEPIDVESAFAAPFPLSGEMARVETPSEEQVTPPESATPAQKTGSKRPISLRMIAIAILLSVIAAITVVNVLA